MASGGGTERLKSYKPLFKDIQETRREREEAGVQLRRRRRDEEVGARLVVSCDPPVRSALGLDKAPVRVRAPCVTRALLMLVCALALGRL